MFQQLDVEGRLRLLRYGMIVIALVAFLMSASLSLFANAGSTGPAMVTGFITTVIVGVIMAAVYFGYSMFLKRSE
jgi:uncharacterized protein YacL